MPWRYRAGGQISLIAGAGTLRQASVPTGADSTRYGRPLQPWWSSATRTAERPAISSELTPVPASIRQCRPPSVVISSAGEKA